MTSDQGSMAADSAPSSGVRALEALRVVAAWQVANGHPDGTPFAHLETARAPENVLRACELLEGLTYGDFVQPGRSAAPGFGPLLTIMAELTDRERAILVDRILADRPTTLTILGRRFGISHQRVAQLERGFRERLALNVAPGTYYGGLIESLVERIGPLSPLPRVLERVPALAELVPGTDVPVWKLLDRISDLIEFKDGWVACPSQAELIRTTRATFADLAIHPGVAVLGADRATWSFSPDEIRDWARLCGQVAIQDFVIEPASNVNDALAQVLMISSGPQTAEALGDMLSLLGGPRSPATVLVALREDRRFVRNHQGRWHLESRPVTYVDAIEEIGRLVDYRREVPLAEVVAALEELSFPSESAVVYADSGRFETVDGLVRERVEPSPVVFPPAEAPGVYHVDGGWAQLVALTPSDIDHRRVRVSTAVSVLLGLRPGGSMPIPSLPGASAQWDFANLFVTLPDETMRRFRVGDRVLLWFGFGAFEVRPAAPLDPDATGYAAALQTFGLPSTGDADSDARALASTLALPAGSGLDKVTAACCRKREWAAAAALRALATATP